MTRQTLLLLVFFGATHVAAADDKEKQARKQTAEKRFKKLEEYCKELRVTHVVELLAEWGEFAELEQQDVVSVMAKAVFDEAAAKIKKTKAEGGNMSFPMLRRFGVSADADLENKTSVASAFFVDDYNSVQPKPPRRVKILSDRPVSQVITSSRAFLAHPGYWAENCVLLTNAPVASFEGLDCCVLITSGDVTSQQTLDGCLVVSRGSVTYRFDGIDRESSCVVAGGGVSDTKAAEFTEKKLPPPEPDPKWVFLNDKKFLGVKFYSSAEDGLEASVEKSVVTVSKLDEKKPFAKAGVKTGDIIESINGEKVPSLHELDRLVCRATVASGVAKLAIKRGDDKKAVEVKLYDW